METHENTCLYVRMRALNPAVTSIDCNCGAVAAQGTGSTVSGDLKAALEALVMLEARMVSARRAAVTKGDELAVERLRIASEDVEDMMMRLQGFLRSLSKIEGLANTRGRVSMKRSRPQSWVEAIKAQNGS